MKFKLVTLLTIFLTLTLINANNDHFKIARTETNDDEWKMVETNGVQFSVNGRPYYFNGFNTYWLMVFSADESTRGKVTDVFQQGASVGLTVCRTWAFNDGNWRALQISPSVYDENVFKGLDFVVSEARKNKIRLILSLVNNWSDYGGKQQYVKWGKEAGLNVSADDDFFSDPTLKTYYKNHVKTVLNRVNTYTNITYKDDPTIFAWELMNEPRCPSDPSGDKLQAWIQEMAVYVKSIDPNHLLEIGSEGFYGPSTPDRDQFNPNSYCTQVGTDFVRNHMALGIDFATIHIYADSWISKEITDAHLEFYKSWLQSHTEDANTKLKMPVVFSEFGVSLQDPGYNSSFRDATYKIVYQSVVDSAKKGGSGAGSLMWQLCPDDVEFMNDGYAVILDKSPSISDIVALTSARLEIVNEVCKMNCRWGCKNRVHFLDQTDF